jgi:chemotaxis protein methyltransferase CheR
MRVSRAATASGEAESDAHGLCDRDFEKFSRLIFEASGIALTDSKKDLLRARLGKILRQRGIPSFRDYLKMVEEDSSGIEVVFMLDAISTNVTSLFREADHFRFLSDVAIPSIDKSREWPADKRFRGWCAGCSSGEEPYSLAVTIREAIPPEARWDVRILATDISTKVLAAAREGAYARPKLKDVPGHIVSRYFSLETGGDGLDRYRVSPEVRAMISFARLNLMDPYPFKGPFDVVFCRNVMIYFDKKTQGELVNRFHRYIADGGYLFIGHSESLNGISHPFQYVRPSVYRKKGALG